MAERAFWRIVRTDPPTERDFMSNDALGRRPRDRDPETLRLWSGISVYATARQARRTAAAFPMLGSFVAQVLIRDDDPVRVEKTLGPDHYTLWGDATLFLAQVERVSPPGLTAKGEGLMARPYEVWDLETGNAIGAFATERAALDAVRDAAITHGRDYVLPWGLARATTRQMHALAHGEALIARALGDRADEARHSANRVAG